MSRTDNDPRLKEGRPVYRTGLHWLVLPGPLLLSVGAFLVGLFSRNRDVSSLAFIWSGLAGIWVAASLLSWITSEFVLSEQRILLKSGFLRRKGLDIGIAKVLGITVEQGMVGRSLGFGTLTVRREGGREDRFGSISSVLEFGTRIAERLAERDAARRKPPPIRP